MKKETNLISELKAGNKRFIEGKSIHTPKSSISKLKEFAKTGQLPKAIVLCCSDSRAPVELIFDQDIGDLFVIRVAGNIVAPSLIGSVEFAASTYGTNLVMVMGHTQCGAIIATLSNIANPDKGVESENVHAIVKRIQPHIISITQVKGLSEADKMRLAVEANVRASVSQLESSSRIIEGFMRDRNLKVVGSVLDLSTGEVSFLED